MVPLKFGINWNNSPFTVLVSIYATDGTVAVTHGGVEMGQGIDTKVRGGGATIVGGGGAGHRHQGKRGWGIDTKVRGGGAIVGGGDGAGHRHQGTRERDYNKDSCSPHPPPPHCVNGSPLHSRLV